MYTFRYCARVLKLRILFFYVTKWHNMTVSAAQWALDEVLGFIPGGIVWNELLYWFCSGTNFVALILTV